MQLLINRFFSIINCQECKQSSLIKLISSCIISQNISFLNGGCLLEQKKIEQNRVIKLKNQWSEFFLLSGYFYIRMPFLLETVTDVQLPNVLLCQTPGLEPWSARTPAGYYLSPPAATCYIWQWVYLSHSHRWRSADPDQCQILFRLVGVIHPSMYTQQSSQRMVGDVPASLHPCLLIYKHCL